MHALAQHCATKLAPGWPIVDAAPRYRVATFVDFSVDLGSDTFATIAQVVDMADPDALVPRGTRITCPAGHPVARMDEALHYGQLLSPEMLAFAAYQGVSRPRPVSYTRWLLDGGPLELPVFLPCLCGRPYTRRTRPGGISIHTEDGWRPDPRQGDACDGGLMP